MARKSIIRRVTTTSVGLVLCGLAGVLLASLVFLYHKSTEQYQSRIEEQLDTLAGSLVQPLWTFDDATVKTICDSYGAHDDVAEIRVIAVDSNQPICHVERETGAELVRQQREVSYRGQEIGTVEIAISKAAFENTVQEILLFGLAAAAVVSALIFVGAREFLAIFLKTPLLTLTRWADEVAQGRYTRLASDVQEVELKDLARQFQGMAQTVAARELELRKLSMATEQSPASVVITDPRGRIEYVNHTFEAVTGFTAAEVIGETARLFAPDGVPEAEREAMWLSINAGETWLGEYERPTRDGNRIFERSRVAGIHDDDGQLVHLIAVTEDITVQKDQEARIRRQAYYDDLTDLPNRFLGMDRLNIQLAEARRHGTQLAVIFLDIDDFKKVNDSLGHEIGDQVLEEAARRLADSLRALDTVARLGGDEFLVLAGDLASRADATPLAEHLVQRFHAPFRFEGREVVLTASLGIACYPEDGDTAEELLRNADTAMYQAKHEGRNTFRYFDSSMNVRVSRRLAVEEQLQNALDRRELHVAYQPIVDVGTGRVRGAEALLRWRNPELGDVSPGEFIPIAEHSGLIVPIGMMVIAEATAAAAHWRQQGADSFGISVNLSPLQLRDGQLVDQVAACLNGAGLPPGALTLEITEGVLMTGHGAIDRSLARLHALGVQIAMDDFGTGYSSLSYLRSYPFSTLKIDRSFVSDLISDCADRELVSAAVRMGHALGMTVVAEGVEREEQRRVLAEVGCELAQGFLFSHAVESQALEAQLAEPLAPGSHMGH